MHEPYDAEQIGSQADLLSIPVLAFQFGLMLLLAPLDEGLHPLRRLAGLCVMLLGPPLVLLALLLVMPLYLVLFYASALWMAYAGESAKFSDEALIVYSRRRGRIAQLKWSDIACVRFSREPPFGLWEIVSITGAILPLPMANGAALTAACKANGVVVKREGRVGGEFTEV